MTTKPDVTVTFADPMPAADRSHSAPAHVTSRVLLNGQPVHGVTDAELAFGKGEATVVTLYVWDEYVAPPFRTFDGTFVAGAIDGVEVLATAQDKMPWEPLPAPMSTDINLQSDTPLAPAPVTVVACHFYANRVVFE